MILEHAIFLGLPRVVLGFQNFGRFCPRALVIALFFFGNLSLRSFIYGGRSFNLSTDVWQNG